jgi:hypothetical protein
MGEIVSFRSDGDSCDGYLALPAAGRGLEPALGRSLPPVA